jgi:hypothetical protein
MADFMASSQREEIKGDTTTSSSSWERHTLLLMHPPDQASKAASCFQKRRMIRSSQTLLVIEAERSLCSSTQFYLWVSDPASSVARWRPMPWVVKAVGGKEHMADLPWGLKLRDGRNWKRVTSTVACAKQRWFVWYSDARSRFNTTF